MKFKFIKPITNTAKLRCTIHRTGKLGFTLDTIKELHLDAAKRIKFATNESDQNDKNLYMFIVNESDEDSFPIIKAGKYVYINTTNTFDEMGYDYKKNRISFTVKEMNENSLKYYKLIKKESERKVRGQKKI